MSTDDKAFAILKRFEDLAKRMEATQVAHPKRTEVQRLRDEVVKLRSEKLWLKIQLKEAQTFLRVK